MDDSGSYRAPYSEGIINKIYGNPTGNFLKNLKSNSLLKESSIRGGRNQLELVDLKNLKSDL